MRYERIDDTICAGGKVVLTGVGESVTLVADETGHGIYVHASGANECHIWSEVLGELSELERFTACSRGETPFWMEPRAGTVTGEVPGDTQWLLARRSDGLFLLLVPILDDPLRFTLDGREGVLRLWADSGDPWTVRRDGVGAYIALGDDPYALQEHGAAAVLHRLGCGALRREKDLPDFVDLFGWCTWDAFYREVSADKVREGLESFRAGGLMPKLVILDDGWLSNTAMPGGGYELTGFEANAKFPGGLAPLIVEARQQYGVERFLVWHAIAGYWCGIDDKSLPAYGAREIRRSDLPAFGREPARTFGWLGAVCSMIPPEKIASFYDDFHRMLASQGVDGVKVDNQSSLEYSTAGLGGRVRVSLAYRQGIEASCRRHFEGRLINCMSMSNEMPMMTKDSTVMRTSTDFWPDLPETHGAHLYINAQVGMWFGQFIHPDWDMFQSAHPMGAFHAAARAISGSPVYVSDKPDQHDFDVLRKIVCVDGTHLRCTGIALPTPGCLFHDPTREDRLLTIFNSNKHGAVIGAFHVKHDNGHAGPISGSISPSDVPGLPLDRYAVLAHSTGEVRVMNCESQWRLQLEPGGWELFTIVPLYGGTAVFGLADKYNSGGAISAISEDGHDTRLRLRDGGTLVFYAAQPPVSINCGGVDLPVTYDASTGKGTVEIPAAGDVHITW